MKFLKTAWYHMRRSPYQSFAAIFIIMQTFFVVSIFSILIYGSAKIIAYFESLPQVTAFFKEDAKQEDIDALKKDLRNSGKVAKMHFVSKQEALKIYQSKFKDDPLLLEFVTADILPSSLEISAKKIQDLAAISQRINKSPALKEVVFPKDIIANLTNWTNALRKIGIAFIAVLGLDSIFIMVIIIGIKISHRREEIEIMRLLGATNWYVRWPFIFEGIIYGIFGAIIGWGVAVLALWYATPFLASFLQGIPLFPLPPVVLLQLLLGELIFALLLGMISSFLAVLRYLK